MNYLNQLISPVLLAGGPKVAYRDPAAVWHEGRLTLFFTVTTIEPNGTVYMYVGSSSSRDLLDWSPIQLLTPRDQSLNFSSPGNVVRYDGEWVLCLQTYPRPNGEKYGNGDARLWFLRGPDLDRWSEPELIRVKGDAAPVRDMGRMIDPFLLRDKDDRAVWWCFYKQNGMSRSRSTDLRAWEYVGHADAGENACVVVVDNEYVLFHSPENGIGVKRSPDLLSWSDGGITTLGQAVWPWARGRITAGFVLDLRDEPGIEKYVMLFHGSGPEDEHTMFDYNASIGIAWSDDLKEWRWPGF